MPKDVLSSGGKAAKKALGLSRESLFQEEILVQERQVSQVTYGVAVSTIALRPSDHTEGPRQSLIPARRLADVDYRLARQTTLDLWRRGDLTQHKLCDAQPMLLRNAVECGTRTEEACPVCTGAQLTYVTYAFGPRLPAHGRCISNEKELARLNTRKSRLTAYVVEVCTSCGWNHLVRITSLGEG